MDDTADDIMAATYRALCEYGYAELTMQRIADNSEKSKAALHYHYDTKDELLQAFLDHMADRFESELPADSSDPEERIRSVVATIFDPAEDDRGRYAIALLEIKAQAPYNDAYRERLRTLDERIRQTVADAVRDGIEQGIFSDVDPEQIARFVATATNGAHAREVAFDEDPAETRALVETYLETELGISFDEGGV